jgi:WD repeat-containing protein 48
MALAHLCKQWEQAQRNTDDDLRVTAFVVDHKAREESSREARMVAQYLQDIGSSLPSLIKNRSEELTAAGVTSQILELSWPPDTPTTAFETHARRLRFQALGKACRDHQIEALLMGHHQDDNVETTLWRLCTGARGGGLAGIPSMTRIPECHGLYGVSESGAHTTLQLKRMRALSFHVSPTNELHVLPDDTTNAIDGDIPATPVLMSTGGILVCRPLLDFPKARLLATCHENNIPYVSDPTNFDPTLTPRNAIRSLISSRKLPRALQAPSILALIRSSQSLLQHSTTASNQLLQTCEALDTNLPAGTIAIRFPSAELSTRATEPLPPHRTHQIQTLTLRRITELISPFPENHFPLRSFEKFTHNVFPAQPADDNSSPTSSPKRHAFTLGGVLFQPLHWPAQTSSSVDDGSTWFLSRQPYMRNRLPLLQCEVSIPKRPSDATSQRSEPEYTPWTLWDNRYWFRFVATPNNAVGPSDTPGVESDSNTPAKISVVIRPFQQSDLQAVRRAVRENQVRAGTSKKTKDPALTAFLSRLARAAPGQVRFTLPLLEVTETDCSGVERRVPLALPTLGLWLPGMRETSLGSTRWMIQWEWMYKMVDMEPLRLMGSL